MLRTSPLFPQSCLILDKSSSTFLDHHAEGITLYSSSSPDPLFEVKEPILLAQGISGESNQIHLAYLKATGELCYSIILSSGEHHTSTLGKLDIQTNRYDRLVLLPVNKVIHIFYAAAHLALPEVWRITHLFWNGRMWQSAHLGEVVHSRHPLYHVLVDSKSNLHVLMMTFLGNRSVLFSSFFNGAFHVWSKRQEALSIPREVIDMTALMSSANTSYVFWAAKQPGTEKFEVGHAFQPRAYDFMSAWQVEQNPLVSTTGPWNGLGAMEHEGVLNVLINADQERLLQFTNQAWNLVSSSPSSHPALQILNKSESSINYTNWLKQNDGVSAPLFASEIQLPVFLNQPVTHESLAPEDPSTPQEEEPEITSIIEAPSSQNETLPIQNPSDPSPSRNQGTEELLITVLQALGEKVDSIPLALESLIKKHEETLESLRLLEDKVNQLQSQQEIARKKGFWQRWFT